MISMFKLLRREKRVNPAQLDRIYLFQLSSRKGKAGRRLFAHLEEFFTPGQLRVQVTSPSRENNQETVKTQKSQKTQLAYAVF